MTTLRRERRQKFEQIVTEWICTSPAVTDVTGDGELLASEIVTLVETLTDAAESRTEKLTPAEIAQVDKKVDAIIGQAREAQSRIDSGTGWRGREFLSPEQLIYGDWWHDKTGLHMYGAKAKAKYDTGWLKAFREMHENELTLSALDEAMAANSWRVLSSPLQIVNDAKAVQAAPKSVQSPQRPEGESSGYYA